MIGSSSLTTRQACGVSPATSLNHLGQYLAHFLTVAYCLLVPLVVIPRGETRYGICEPLLLLMILTVFLTQTLYRPQVFHIAMAAFLAVALLSLFLIDNDSVLVSSAQRWVRLVAMSAPLFLGLTFYVTSRTVRLAFRSFFWGGLFAILIGLVIYWLQIPIHDKSQMFWIEGEDPTIRASGLIGDTGAFGHLVATWALASLGGLLLFRGKGWWIGIAVVLSLATYAIIASSSRGALLNLVTGCFVLWLLYLTDRRHKLNVFLGAIGLASCLVTVLMLASMLGLDKQDSFREKFFERFFAIGHGNVNSFASNRFEGWNAYISEFSDQFILGTGYKTSDVILPGRTTDNVLLCVAVETGIMGVVSLCVFMGGLFMGLFNRMRQGNRYAVVICSIWCGQVLHGMTADTHTLWLAMPPLYLLTGLVMCMQKEEAQP